MGMFDNYMADLASDLTPEELDVMDEKYRTGLDAIRDNESEADDE